MTDFNVDIKVDATNPVAATARVSSALDALERKGKTTGDSLTSSLGQGLGGAMDVVNGKVRELTRFVGELGLASTAVTGLASAFASVATSVISGHVAMLAMNDQLIEMRNRLRNVTDGQTAFNFALANTRTLADRSLTGWDATVDVYARTANATRELGLSQQHVTRLTETLSKMFQASGRSAGETSAAMLQLSQALGSGVLQGDEFRSLAENAPQLLNVFARELGVTRGELKKLASEGKITTDVMISGLDKMAESADRAFDRMEKTFSQKVRPMLNELQGDPNKLTRAVGGDLGDVSDLANSMHKAGMTQGGVIGQLGDALVGDYSRIQAATGAVADYGRQVVDLGAKMSALSEEMARSAKVDPFATAKPALLGFEMQLQQLIERVEYLNGPRALQDGAVAWKALGTSIALFADGAVSDLDRVLGRVAGVLAPGGGMNSVQLAIRNIAAKATGADDPWTNTLSFDKKRTGGGSKAWVPETGYWDAVSADLKNAAAALELFDYWADNSAEHFKFLLDLSEQARDKSVSGGALAAIGGDANAGFARDSKFLAPANAETRKRTEQANAEEVALIRMQQRAEETATIMRAAFGSVENALVKLATTGEFSFRNMMEAMMADLARLAANRLIMSLIGALTPTPSYANALPGGVLPQAFPGLYGGAHATGGYYRAPMTGGAPDSIPVMFRMSPGEVASFTPQGSGDGGGPRGRDRVIYVDRGRQLTAAQQEEEVVRIALKNGFTRR